MFVSPINVLRIQEELKDYQRLCQEYNHSPAKEEFDDIIKFILLMSGNGTGIYESAQYEIMDEYLYKKFIKELNENNSVPRWKKPLPEKLLEVEAGDQTASALVSAGSGAVQGAVGAVAFGAEKIGTWITYFFKKGKVKKFAMKEFDLSNKLLDEYTQIYKLMVKKAELEGKDPPKADYPGYLG
jgi:hypothetical protein